MEVSFEPLHDNVLVEELDPDERKTAGGVILPPGTEAHTVFATVKAVGPGLFLDSGQRLIPDLNKGDIIVMETNVGLFVELEHAPFQILRYENVLGVVYRAPSE